MKATAHPFSKLIISVCACIISCGFAVSADAHQTPGWYSVGKVTRIHPGNTGSGFLFSTEAQLTIAGCADNVHGYIFPDIAGSGNRNFATLLTAYTMGKSVSIYLTGGCPDGRPEVNTVEIQEVGYF